MTDQQDMPSVESADAPVLQERRDFLRGLGKWSQAVIGGVLAGSGLTVPQPTQAGSWINRRGGGWINGGGAWINRRDGGWYNRGGRVNRGGSWLNGGGGSWVNRRGGRSWINR